MRSIFRYSILALFCGLFMMQSIAAQDKSTEPQTEKTDKTGKTDKTPKGLAPVTLDDLAVNFPEVEGWDIGDIQKYPTEDLGFSVNYESRAGGRVTIYVYDGGKKNILDDLTDKTIKSELNSAKNEIKKVAEMGYYKKLKELKNETVTLGGTSGKIKVLYTLYNFTSDDTYLTSEIYIFGRKNKFIKIRATRPRDENETGDKMVADLLKELDAFFSS